MPRCPKCKQEFTAANNGRCPLCDFQIGPTSPSSPTLISGKSETSTTPEKVSPFKRVCEQAAKLDEYGGFVFGASLLLAVIIVILSGYGAEVDRYGDVKYVFLLARMFFSGSIIWALALIGTANVIRMVMRGFAVIVESSYRSMS